MDDDTEITLTEDEAKTLGYREEMRKYPVISSAAMVEEIADKLKAIWNIIRGRKTLFKATPRVIVKPGDQEMFAAIMSERLRLVDTSPVFQAGTYSLLDGNYFISNTIILEDGMHTERKKKEVKTNE